MEREGICMKAHTEKEIFEIIIKIRKIRHNDKFSDGVKKLFLKKIFFRIKI